MIYTGSNRSFFSIFVRLYVYLSVFSIGIWNSTAAMRLVVQRVKSASVSVDNEIVSHIGPGAM